jgi:hypothetical protein
VHQAQYISISSSLSFTLGAELRRGLLLEQETGFRLSESSRLAPAQQTLLSRHHSSGGVASASSSQCCMNGVCTGGICSSSLCLGRLLGCSFLLSGKIIMCACYRQERCVVAVGAPITGSLERLCVGHKNNSIVCL